MITLRDYVIYLIKSIILTSLDCLTDYKLIVILKMEGNFLQKFIYLIRYIVLKGNYLKNDEHEPEPDWIKEFPMEYLFFREDEYHMIRLEVPSGNH